MSSAAGPRTLSFNKGAIRFDPDLSVVPDVSWFDPCVERLQARPVQAGGRQAAWYISTALGAGVLRQYRRGGLVARLSQNRYLWSGEGHTRSFAEFDLLHFMYRHGLPVPRPWAAAYWRCGLTYRAAIVVECFPCVLPLAKMLALPHHKAVACAIIAMHNAGVWHADLNAYNILLNEQGQVWLIDFDRGRRQVLSARQKWANLLRLRRSLIKTAGTAGLDYWNQLILTYRGLLADVTAPQG